MAFQQLQVGGGAGNIGRAYSNTNQLAGYSAFQAPVGAAQLPSRPNFLTDPTGGGLKKSDAPPQRNAPSMSPWQTLRRDTAGGTADNNELQRRAGLGTEWTSSAYYTGGNRSAPSHYKYDNQSGYYYNPSGAGANTVPTTPEQPINTWQQKLGESAVQGQRKPPNTAPVAQGLLDKSYIQLANILNTGQADRYGVSDEDLVNAMESIKQSSYNG